MVNIFWLSRHKSKLWYKLNFLQQQQQQRRKKTNYFLYNDHHCCHFFCFNIWVVCLLFLNWMKKKIFGGVQFSWEMLISSQYIQFLIPKEEDLFILFVDNFLLEKVSEEIIWRCLFVKLQRNVRSIKPINLTCTLYLLHSKSFWNWMKGVDALLTVH
jgi:hypothetical protein